MNAVGNHLTVNGKMAGADLSTSQYLAVRYLSTADNVGLATSPSHAFAGILMNDPKLGEHCYIAAIGATVGIAAAPIAAGADVNFNGAGRLITSTGAAVGRAIEAASTGGAIFRVMLGGQ